MHSAGEMYVSHRVAHILKEVRRDTDPWSDRSEKYIALCTRESQSWALPDWNIQSAQFAGSVDVTKGTGARICTTCFGTASGIEILPDSWQSLLPDLVTQLPPAEDQKTALTLAKQILKDFHQGDLYLTTMYLYISTGRGSADIYAGYEDSGGLRETGSEDTMSSLRQAHIGWNGADSSEPDHIQLQIKRSVFLASELKRTLIINSPKEKMTYYVNKDGIVRLSNI